VQNRKAVWNRHDLRVEIDRRLAEEGITRERTSRNG
jgi:hypothetical protein